MPAQFPGIKTLTSREGDEKRFAKSRLGGEWQTTESGRDYLVEGGVIFPGTFVALSPRTMLNQDSIPGVIQPNADGTHLKDYELSGGVVTEKAYDTDAYIDVAKVGGLFKYVGVSVHSGCRGDCEREWSDAPLPPLAPADELTKWTYAAPYRPTKNPGGSIHVVYRDSGFVRCVEDIGLELTASQLYVVETVVNAYNPATAYVEGSYTYPSVFGWLSTNTLHGPSLVDIGFGATIVTDVGKAGGVVGIELRRGV